MRVAIWKKRKKRRSLYRQCSIVRILGKIIERGEQYAITQKSWRCGEMKNVIELSRIIDPMTQHFLSLSLQMQSNQNAICTKVLWYKYYLLHIIPPTEEILKKKKHWRNAHDQAQTLALKTDMISSIAGRNCYYKWKQWILENRDVTRSWCWYL